MSDTDRQVVRELIRTLRDGTNFYRNAIEKTEHAGHRAIFERMIISREAAISYLQPYQDSFVGLSHSFGSVLHKLYPEILDGLDSSHDALLRQHIELIERETLQKMQQSLQRLESPLLQLLLLDLHPRLTRDHVPACPLDKAC